MQLSEHTWNINRAPSSHLSAQTGPYPGTIMDSSTGPVLGTAAVGRSRRISVPLCHSAPQLIRIMSFPGQDLCEISWYTWVDEESKKPMAQVLSRPGPSQDTVGKMV